MDMDNTLTFLNSKIIFAQHNQPLTFDDLRYQKPRVPGLASSCVTLAQYCTVRKAAQQETRRAQC